MGKLDQCASVQIRAMGKWKEWAGVKMESMEKLEKCASVQIKSMGKLEEWAGEPIAGRGQ